MKSLPTNTLDERHLHERKPHLFRFEWKLNELRMRLYLRTHLDSFRLHSNMNFSYDFKRTFISKWLFHSLFQVLQIIFTSIFIEITYCKHHFDCWFWVCVLLFCVHHKKFEWNENWYDDLVFIFEIIHINTPIDTRTDTHIHT